MQMREIGEDIEYRGFIFVIFTSREERKRGTGYNAAQIITLRIKTKKVIQ